MRLLRIGILSLVLPACMCRPGAGNPYGVAGTGVLQKLGMPAGSWDYSWDSLVPTNPVNMVRPCKYWLSVGLSHRYWGYHETTDTIDDPVQFADYVAANPGKIWIIGNEPDIGSQDGLTQQQYACMFHTYYTFIKALDPTARFAIGAISGGSNAAGLSYTISWYQGVLDIYKTTFGAAMPVDIWNVHSYVRPIQVEDPDRIINEFVTPFVNWCRTIEGGAYAGCEVWITELPIGEWMGALSEDNVIWFMQRYMPRLEQTGITRWFWYVSSDWDGKQGSCALTRSGQVTPVGSAYAALANGYPNPVPPIEPFSPYAPDLIEEFDFSGEFADPWFNKGGYWSNTDGELRHTGVYPFSGTTCLPLFVYQDSIVSFRMKINSAADPLNWGGVALRVANRFNVGWESGYLVFVRQNGEIGLFNGIDGTVATGTVSNPQNYHLYRVQASGSNMKVWVDGSLKIDWTDPNARFLSGYTIVQAHKADISVDDFRLFRCPLPTPVVTDGGRYTNSFNHLEASWTMSDYAGVQSYKFAIGTTPGGTNIANWTSTTQTSISLTISLAAGSTYYFSVKAIYADGVEGPVGTSDGVMAAINAPTTSDAKKLASGTFVALEDKVVSANFLNFLYVQEPDRSSGIRVLGTLDVQVGDTVTVAGNVGVAYKEAYLNNPRLLSRTPGEAPLPVAMNNRATGGGACGLQPAVLNKPGEFAAGVSTVGLLVRTAGTVTYVDPGSDFVYIDDGSNLADGYGKSGVRVSLAACPTPALGATALITACCGAYDLGGKCVRLLRPRSQSDVQFSSTTNYLADSGFESGYVWPWTNLGSWGSIVTGTWYGGTTPHLGYRYFGIYRQDYIYSGSLYQRVIVPEGTYRASVWSRLFHGADNIEQVKNRIGIDPAGGTDPNSPGVVWSEWDTQPRTNFGEWHLIGTPDVTVAGGPVTVFLQYVQTDPYGYHINCFDDAVLARL